MLKGKIKNTEQSLPPISLNEKSAGSVLNVRKKSDSKKASGKTESILAKMPKLKSTSPSTGGGLRFGGKLKLGDLASRLKKFSPKELGLLAGALAAVAALPIGAYMMSADTAEDGSGKPGFYASKTGGELFEPGLNGFAPGGTGIGGETITPLSVRDPLSLILGLGKDTPDEDETAAPPAYPSTPSRDDSRDFRDTITAAAPAAAQAVAETFSAPNVPRLNGAVRGLGAVSAGGSGGITGQLNSGKIAGTAGSAPSKIASSGMANPIAPKGFLGAGRSNKSSANAYDSLRAKAGAAADEFNVGGGAGSADRASKASNFGTGGVVGGSIGGGGRAGKKAGSGGGKGGKSTVSHQQSSAQKLAEKRAEKEMELEFMAKEARLQNKLEMEKFLTLQLPQQMMSAAAEPVAKKIKDTIDSLLNPEADGTKGPGYIVCVKNKQLIEADGAMRRMSDSDKIGDFKTKCKENMGKPTREDEYEPGGGDVVPSTSPVNPTEPDMPPDTAPAPAPVTPGGGNLTGTPQEIVKQLRDNAPGDRTTLMSTKQSTLASLQAATDPASKAAAVQGFVAQSQQIVSKFEQGSKGLGKENEDIARRIQSWQTEGIASMTASKDALLGKYGKAISNSDKFTNKINANKELLESVTFSSAPGHFVNLYSALTTTITIISGALTTSQESARQSLEKKLADENTLLTTLVPQNKQILDQRNVDFTLKLQEASAQIAQLQSAPMPEAVESVFNLVTTENPADAQCTTLLGCLNYANGTKEAADAIVIGNDGISHKLPMNVDLVASSAELTEKTKDSTILLMKSFVANGRSYETRSLNKQISAEATVATSLNARLKEVCKTIDAKVRKQIGMTSCSFPM